MNLNKLNPKIRSISLMPFIWSHSNREPSVSYVSKLFYCTEGHGSISVKDKKYDINPYSLITFPPETSYRINCNLQKPLILAAVSFDYTYRHNDESISYQPVFLSEYNSKSHPSAYDDTFSNDIIFVQNCSNAEADILQMVQEFRQKKDYSEEINSAILKKVLLLAFRDANSNESKRLPVLDSVLDYIHKNCSEDLTNEMLANKFNYNPCYLNRIFKEYTGKTLHDYIISYKISTAVQMIKTTDMSVSEISAVLGFKNYSHFSYVFKKRKKISPLHFRNNINNI